MTAPRLFISYSWTTPEHENWVEKLAEELRSNGVDVILDKWDLKPGHDANAFMEQMVSDPNVTKVILVCDQKYAEKSDMRHGGAGTEAQIITPEIYQKKRQDKFVAVVRDKDKDGNAFVPVYYKGRIFIDLSSDAIYASQFEQLLRWIFDKPLHIKPELGKPPSFIDEESATFRLTTSIEFRRVIDAVKGNHATAIPTAIEYFETFVSEMEKIRLAIKDHDDAATFDDKIIASIESFLPYRNQIIEVFLTISSYMPTSEMIAAQHRFFEKLLPLTRRPPGDGIVFEHQEDNLLFIVHELLLYCLGAMVKYRCFKQFAEFLDEGFYFPLQNIQNSMRTFTEFRRFLKGLDIRNQRLSLNRLSLRADMLFERAKASGIEFQYLMTVDLILFIRARASREYWWPETLLYFGYSDSPAELEIFARAKSKRFFEHVCVALGVRDKTDFDQILQKIETAPEALPRWQFETFNPRRAVAFDQLATAP